MALATLTCLAACQESNWDDHYQTRGDVAGNLKEVLQLDGHFTKFLSVMAETGGDSILTGAQTYTVWAPDDEAMVAYTMDENTRKQFVQNHLSRFLYGQENLVDTSLVKVGMVNGKVNDYTKEGNTYSLASIPLGSTHLLATNGVVHSMSGIIPFYYNMYEKIQYDHTLDSLNNYLKAFDTRTFNASTSTAIGQNEYGQTIYDSIFDYSSYWMKKYGDIYLEDSTYTMLVPTNTAYRQALAQMKPCYRTFGELLADNSPSGKSLIVKRTYSVGTADADSVTNAHVHQMIANDLVFRGRLNPLTTHYDSLYTTAGHVIHDVAALFEGSEMENVSNGRAFVTNQWNIDPLDTWHKEIRVEAEKSTHLQLYTTTPTTYSAANTSFANEVSNQAFLEVENSTTTATMQPQIIFDITGTLAAKYNIYVVFAPITARDASSAADSTRVRFYLNYVHSDGNMYEDDVISNNPETGKEFITDGKKMTKMLVAKNFIFPMANVNMSVNSKLATTSQAATVKLRMQTNVARTETTKFSKIMRIDCIILEPVKDESK